MDAQSAIVKTATDTGPVVVVGAVLEMVCVVSTLFCIVWYMFVSHWKIVVLTLAYLFFLNWRQEMPCIWGIGPGDSLPVRAVTVVIVIMIVSAET
jgi:hypothetical protein